MIIDAMIIQEIQLHLSIYITFKILLLVGEPPVLVMVTEGVPHPQTDLDLIHSEQ